MFIRLLGRTGFMDAAPYLTECLKENVKNNVHTYSFCFVEALGNMHFAPASQYIQVTSRPLRLISSKSTQQERERLIDYSNRALAKIGGAENLKFLMQTLVVEKPEIFMHDAMSPMTKSYIIAEVLKSGIPEYKDFCLSYIDSVSWQKKECIGYATILGNLNTDKSRQILLRYLNIDLVSYYMRIRGDLNIAQMYNEHESVALDVREAAAISIAKIYTPDIKEKIVELLKGTSKYCAF